VQVKVDTWQVRELQDILEILYILSLSIQMTEFETHKIVAAFRLTICYILFTFPVTLKKTVFHSRRNVFQANKSKDRKSRLAYIFSFFPNFLIIISRYFV
jgi:hypothetical protein